MRAPEQTKISAPAIPTGLAWANSEPLRLEDLRGRPLLIEFNDLLRPPCLRQLAYTRAWQRRYGADGDGLTVVTTFAPSLPFSADDEAARALAGRLGLDHPVLLDLELRLWRIYENAGWPTRYLFDDHLTLVDFHVGEGGYRETESAIAGLLGTSGPLIADSPLHAIDDPAARIVVPTPDQDGPWSGEYEAGEVWALLEGSGTIEVDGEPRAVSGSGPMRLVAHERHTHDRIEIRAGSGVTCHAVCFSPGLAPE